MNNELYHFGIKGMKWGVRRYRNSDGSLNAKGKQKVNEYAYKINRKANMAGESYSKAYAYGKRAKELKAEGKKKEYRIAKDSGAKEYEKAKQQEKYIKSDIKSANKKDLNIGVKENPNLTNARKFASELYVEKKLSSRIGEVATISAVTAGTGIAATLAGFPVSSVTMGVVGASAMRNLSKYKLVEEPKKK